MLGPTTGYQVDERGAVWILCDLREPAAVAFIHAARASFQERSDLIALDADHLILELLPGGAQEGAA